MNIYPHTFEDKSECIFHKDHESTLFEKEHFLKAWATYAGKSEYDYLSVANALPFVHEMMSFSIEDKRKL